MRTDTTGDAKVESKMKAVDDSANDVNKKIVKTADYFDSFVYFDFMIICDMGNSDEAYYVVRKFEIGLPGDLILDDIEEEEPEAPLNNDLESKFWENDDVSAGDVQFFTADHPDFSQFLIGNPVNLKAWVRLDGGNTIHEFVKIFKENFLNDGAESEGHQKPLLIRYIPFYY